MKKSLCAVLTFILMLPAFLQFAPHKTVHALYDAHIIHHGETSHHNQVQFDYSHNNNGDHTFITDEDIHHGIPTDIASYYSDFLHVDLRHVDADSLVPLINLDRDIDYDMTADIAAQNRHELTSLQTRAPPIRLAHTQDHSSLYLETLRLRI